jgi:asparagine synthase (glutamine-hydrolysing)
MCGILGVYSKKVKINQELFKNSLELLSHRGPDHQGFFINNEETCAIGHTRLSIIDLDERSNQPMLNEKTESILTYNGEFYNFKEVREELVESGHSFKTNSDTEVFLKSYDEWGMKFLEKVNGFYAGGIHSKDGTIFLIRDRFGIKPLYYYNENDLFIYSSEIKPILNYIEKYKVNKSVLNYYFSYRYNISNETMFQNVKKVPAAHYIEFREGNLKLIKYWDLKSKIQNSSTKSNSIETFNKKFESSIEKRLISDRDVGLYLSGGIDSNAIGTVMANKNAANKSYSISFESIYDESKEILESANLYGFSSTISSINESDFSDYERAQFYLEEPIGDSIVLPTMKLSETSSKDCNVVMSGEGADEILNGYVHHVSLFKEEKVLRYIPKILHGLIPIIFKILPISLINAIFPYPSELGQSGLLKLIEHFKNLTNPFKRIDSLTNIFFGDDFKKYLSDSMQKDKNEHEIKLFIDSNKELSFDKLVTLMDLTFWNPNYTLHRLDKLNMSHSVEARVPFLDHNFAEFVLSLPLSTKMSFRKTKKILRESIAVTNKSKKITNRPKMPFYFPIRELGGDEFEKMLNKYLTCEKLEELNIFKTEAIIELRDKKNLELIEGKRLFIILSFMQWYELFFSEINILDNYRKYQGVTDRSKWSNTLVVV